LGAARPPFPEERGPSPPTLLRSNARRCGLLSSSSAVWRSVVRATRSPGRAPAWVPAYTPEQEALLAPGNAPINVPARRVFPDLERFAYSDDVILTDP